VGLFRYKVTLLQDAKVFKTYLNTNPDQFSEMEMQLIRGFQPARDKGFISGMISIGDYSSFHRVFVDSVTRAMFSTRGEDYQFMSDAQQPGGNQRGGRVSAGLRIAHVSVLNAGVGLLARADGDLNR
jgi:hypothetical protein